METTTITNDAFKLVLSIDYGRVVLDIIEQKGTFTKWIHENVNTLGETKVALVDELNLFDQVGSRITFLGGNSKKRKGRGDAAVSTFVAAAQAFHNFTTPDEKETDQPESTEIVDSRLVKFLNSGEKTTTKYWKLDDTQIADIKVCKNYTLKEMTTNLESFGLRVGDPIVDTVDNQTGTIVRIYSDFETASVAHGNAIYEWSDFKSRWRTRYWPLKKTTSTKIIHSIDYTKPTTLL